MKSAIKKSKNQKLLGVLGVDTKNGKRLPRGIRKYIRKRKMEIRKSFTFPTAIDNEIKKLYDELRNNGIKVVSSKYKLTTKKMADEEIKDSPEEEAEEIEEENGDTEV